MARKISTTNLARAFGLNMPTFTRFIAAYPNFPTRASRSYWEIGSVREWIIANPRHATMRVEEFDLRVAEIFSRKNQYI